MEMMGLQKTVFIILIQKLLFTIILVNQFLYQLHIMMLTI